MTQTSNTIIELYILTSFSHFFVKSRDNKRKNALTIRGESSNLRPALAGFAPRMTSHEHDSHDTVLCMYV